MSKVEVNFLVSLLPMSLLRSSFSWQLSFFPLTCTCVQIIYDSGISLTRGCDFPLHSILEMSGFSPIVFPNDHKYVDGYEL